MKKKKATKRRPRRTAQKAPPRPDGYAAVLKTFGDIRKFIKSDGTLNARWEMNCITRIVMPASLPYSANTSIKITRVACHYMIAPLLSKVLKTIYDNGLWKKLENYGGCFNYRSIRGEPKKVSLHSFGIAIDFDTEDNPLGSTDLTNMDPAIVTIFENAGFLWGGHFKGRKDPMHFQYAINC